jgi:cobalt-precorrin-5B (C1)-methyltransferase
MIVAHVRLSSAEAGVRFKAGKGVGTVTRAGLPVKPGEPAINPVPRQMMRAVVESLAAAHGAPGDVEIEIAIPGGEALAEKTWNPRLGIKGGLSILGTTGIVKPFSCAAWIASIHRGIDVARAAGFTHIAGATGSTSESAVRSRYQLPLEALIDMGDFVGGMLKYVREHPVPRVTVAGGFGKITKMAQGAMDLHSGRSQVDFDWLAARVLALGGHDDLAAQVRRANTAMEAEAMARGDSLSLADDVAEAAREAGITMLRGADVALDILVVDRGGQVIGHAG